VSIIWDIIIKELPVLKEQMEKVLKDWELISIEIYDLSKVWKRNTVR
jgi:hypothetical protein